jgi:sporulation protein YlmC with PRC-barrel domain
MPEMTEAYDWRGRTILDTRVEKIGTINQVYLNLETDEPEWAQVD